MSENRTKDIIGQLFSSSVEIAEIILSNFSYLELCRVRGVCTIWNDISLRIIQRRKICHYLCVNPIRDNPKVEAQQVMTCLKERCLSPTDVSIVFHNEILKQKKKCSRFELNFPSAIRIFFPPGSNIICASSAGTVGTNEKHNSYEPVGEPDESDGDEDYIQPIKKRKTDWISYADFRKSFDECFPCLKDKILEKDLFQVTKKYLNGRNILRYELITDTIECCDDHQPPETSLFYFDNTVNVNSASRRRGYLKSNCLKVPAPGHSFLVPNFHGLPPFQFTMLCLPGNIPGIEIIPVELSSNFIGVEQRAFDPRFESDVKAVLAISSHNEYDDIVNCTNDIVKKQEGRVAFAGAQCMKLNATLPKENCYGKAQNCLIVFKGEKVSAASILVDSAVTSHRDLVNEYSKLKTFHDPSKESIAFLFPCVARGQGWYDEEDEEVCEVASFRKIYPNTPVFGFFGEAELCREYIPGTTKLPDLDDMDDLNDTDLLHSYCISILFLQFDK